MKRLTRALVLAAGLSACVPAPAGTPAPAPAPVVSTTTSTVPDSNAPHDLSQGCWTRVNHCQEES